MPYRVYRDSIGRTIGGTDDVLSLSNQIKSFNVYKAAHSQYTQCDKNQRFHVCAVETKSIKANTNNVQLCKTNFVVAGQQI